MFRQKLRFVFLNLLILILISTNISTMFAASTGKDITGHWAEQQLLDWSNKGWINGYPDGSIRPDAPVTRAEYMAMMNKAFDFHDQAEINFKDVKLTGWQYTVIATAVKAGYVKGYADNTIHPDIQLSRQEAAVMLEGPLNIASESTSSLDSFKDSAQIAAWSQGAVATLVNKNVLAGYKDLTFGPAKAVTRAEAVVMINRALKVRTTLYANAGSFGPDNVVESVPGNVTIQATGITLRNMVIDGDLLFAASIGSGEAYLKNVTVHGKTVVNGGGSNSIHIEDSTLASVTVNKQDGDVRIVAEGTTTVAELNVESGAKIEQSNVSKGGFASIILSELLPPDSKIKLTGSFENVDVAGKGISIELSNGAIGKLNVVESATGTSINMDKDSIIKDLVLNADVHATGTGKIEKATVNEHAKNTILDVITTIVEGKGVGSIKLITPAPASNPTPVPAANGSNPPSNNPPITGGGAPSNTDDTKTNHAPSGTVPSKLVVSGTGPWTISLSSLIKDADGDIVTFSEAASDKIAIATANLNGSNLTLTEVKQGRSEISFKYTDGKSAVVTTSFVLNIDINIATTAALSSNVIEVTLAHTISEMDRTLFTVTNPTNQSLVIQTATYAAYDITNKTILLKLEKNVQEGVSYKVSSGISFASFIGVAVDVAKPFIVGAESTSNTEVTVQFSEPVQLVGVAFEIKLVFGDKSSLPVKNIKYLTKSKLVLQTASQIDQLYGFTGMEIVDFAQLTADLANLPMFSGRSDPRIKSIEAKSDMIGFHKIYVDLAVDYDVSKLSSASITVSEAYGDRGDLPIESIHPATIQDAVKYGYDSSLAQAAAVKGIVITIAANTNSRTLYKVSIKNLLNASGDLLFTAPPFPGGYTTENIQISSVVEMIATNKIYVDLEYDYDRDMLKFSTINITGEQGLEQANILISDISPATFQETVKYGYSETTAHAAVAKGIVITLKSNTYFNGVYKVDISNLSNTEEDLYTTAPTFVGVFIPVKSGIKMLSPNKIYLDLDTGYDASKLSSAMVDVDEVYGQKTHSTIADIKPASAQDAINYGYEDTLAGGAATRGIVITLNQETSMTLYRVIMSNLTNQMGELVAFELTVSGGGGK